MDLNFKLLALIDNIVKLSNDFDSGFKIMFDLESNVKIDENKAEILYSMTKNYILIRKEHGKLILIMNKLINSADQMNLINNDDDNNSKEKNLNKNISKKDKNNIDNNTNNDNINNDNNINKDNNNNKDINVLNDTNILFDISTFSTLLNNVNDLINNVDYEYKKIAIKYPKFINKSQITIILISDQTDNKYDKLIEELKINYPEHKYKIIKCGDKQMDIKSCQNELKEFGIKINSIKSLPLLYIINNSTVSEIDISLTGDLKVIRNLIE